MAEEVKDGIFREIDEELRHEHYAKLWKRHGKFIITLAVFLVAGVAGYKAWQSYDINTRRGESERFAAVMAVKEPEAKSAAAFAKLAGEFSGGYALLSRFQEAAAKAKAGDPGGAAEIYRKIAGNSGVDVVYRDLAVVLGVTLEMATAGRDAAALDARIAPLMADDNPWRHSAREISAALALKSGDDKKALGLFTKLARDATTPPGIKKRAAEIARALGEALGINQGDVKS